METFTRNIEIYQSLEGKRPYLDWLYALKDKKTKGLIHSRINRIRLENFGDCERVGQGVYELKIHYGPGFRIYFGIHAKDLVLLLSGGSKKTQVKDIQIAQGYWQDYQRRTSL